jgi:hypothetical protein
MTILATYPKFSSIAFLYFELQQKDAKLNLNFHSKSIWSCFAKVEDLFSLRPTKLSLHFSEFSVNF